MNIFRKSIELRIFCHDTPELSLSRLIPTLEHNQEMLMEGPVSQQMKVFRLGKKEFVYRLTQQFGEGAG